MTTLGYYREPDTHRVWVLYILRGTPRRYFEPLLSSWPQSERTYDVFGLKMRRRLRPITEMEVIACAAKT